MTRWAPDAQGRLQLAALELYSERGYDQTTVTEIAKRAGLTERTFFRHFADKREVLFYGSGMLQDRLVSGIEAAPAGLPPVAMVVVALESAAEPMEEVRDLSRHRQAVIAANPELQERELIKLAALSSALAEALRGRGVPESAAALAAEVGIAVFKIAVHRWTESPVTGTLAQLIRQSLADLKTVAVGA